MGFVRRLAIATCSGGLTFIAFSFAAAAGGCHPLAPLAEGTSPTVRIANCGFTAGITRVPVGTTVSWTNEDPIPHVVSGVGWGQLQQLAQGTSFSHTFDAAGIYPYTCYFHPGMSAVVIVGAAESAPSPNPAQPAPASSEGWPMVSLIASLIVGAAGFAGGRLVR